MPCDRCKEEFVPVHDGTGLVLPGYGTNDKGEKICYNCCGELDLESLKTADTFLLYLHSKEPYLDYTSRLRKRGAVTNWPGTLRIDCTYQMRTPQVSPLTGTRHQLCNVWFTDPHGGRWYGLGPGPGMYIKVRKLGKTYKRAEVRAHG